MHYLLYTCDLQNIVCQLCISKGKRDLHWKIGHTHCCTSEAEHSTERKVVLIVHLGSPLEPGVDTCADSTSRFQGMGLRANHMHETCLQQ